MTNKTKASDPNARAASVDPKLRLFGWPDAARLAEAGLDGWYLVRSPHDGANAPYATIMSKQRKNVVASLLGRVDAEEIVTTHNRDLLAKL